MSLASDIRNQIDLLNSGKTFSNKPFKLKICGVTLFHKYRNRISYLMGDDLLMRGDIDINKKYKKGTREYWVSKVKRLCPIQYWVREDLSFFFNYWFSYYPIHRWYDFKQWLKDGSTLKIRFLDRGGYYDEDKLLTEAVFEVFCRFMDQKPDKYHEYNPKWADFKDSFQSHAEFSEWAGEKRRLWSDYQEIYKYITIDRVKMQKKIDKALTEGSKNKNYKSLTDLEEISKANETKYLHKIIDLRQSLWI